MTHAMESSSIKKNRSKRKAQCTPIDELQKFSNETADMSNREPYSVSSVTTVLVNGTRVTEFGPSIPIPPHMELIARVQQLEDHVFNLKNILNKQQKSQQRDSSTPHSHHNKKRGRPFDHSKHHKRHILLKFFYLGWDYHGYMEQENSTSTIEHYLFDALRRSCLIANIDGSNYSRCGRTDKGVSAFSQVISLDIRSCLPPESQAELSSELPYCKILNRLLPENIRCVAWFPALRDDMSARFDCTHRTYRYFFPRSNLNIEAMQKAASYLVGVHDFRNLCKMDVRNGVVDFTRNIKTALVREIAKDDTPGDEFKLEMNPYDLCELVICGKAFLWHQVRCIVSVLFLVGREQESPEVILDLLDLDKCPKKPQYPLASELPLCLFFCDYDVPSSEWLVDEEEMNRVFSELQSHWTKNAVKAVMIRHMLQDLEARCSTRVYHHSNCLIQGVNAKIYQPLLTRHTCLSLEKKIDHYVKRRKLLKVGSEDVIKLTDVNS